MSNNRHLEVAEALRVIDARKSPEALAEKLNQASRSFVNGNALLRDAQNTSPLYKIQR